MKCFSHSCIYCYCELGILELFLSINYWVFKNLTSLFLDANETAKDMTDRYKSECANMKVRPIGKLLEQLEVSC